MRRRKFNQVLANFLQFLHICIIIILVFIWATLNYSSHVTNTAFNAIHLVNTTQDKSDKKIRILIVPGHEPNFGGAEFRGIKERDLAVSLGEDLEALLKQNGRYEVFITRQSESWNPVFADYFKNNWNDIIVWAKSKRQDELALIEEGLLVKPLPQIRHNTASRDVAIRLYGITKWANENQIDLMLHIHFDDYRGHANHVGKYSGFTIYVPVLEYSNGLKSHPMANSIFKELSKHNPVSNFKTESGIVDEPRLIAIGSHNTAESASLLIEYGYIYEKKFSNQTTRSQAISDLANQTYLGINNFFAK